MTRRGAVSVNISKRLRSISIGTMLAAGIAMMGPVAASRHPQRGNSAEAAVTVEGEVGRVLGPSTFTLVRRKRVDPEREMLVVVPAAFAAIVQSDAPVRVTGTVQKVAIAEIKNRRGVLTHLKTKTEVTTRPVLRATVVSSLAPAAVEVNLLVRLEAPVGTSESGATAPVIDANQVARSTDKSMVGKRVNLRDVKVAATGDRGFWIIAPSGARIFVMPTDKISPRSGQTATIQGIVLELPEDLRVELNASAGPIYIYAERVEAR